VELDPRLMKIAKIKSKTAIIMYGVHEVQIRARYARGALVGGFVGATKDLWRGRIINETQNIRVIIVIELICSSQMLPPSF